jgi:hypothetical protein
MNAQLKARLLKPTPAPSPRASIGMASTENADRAAYQSARSRDGFLAPLPLTLAEALAEAEKTHTFRQSKEHA